MLLLILSLLALVVTKLADVVTTVRGIRRAGGEVDLERNPLARGLLRRFGLRGGVALVMTAWLGVVALVYGVVWFAPPWYQAAVALVGFFVAWAQWQVARHNASGQSSAPIRFFERLFARLDSLTRPRT